MTLRVLSIIGTRPEAIKMAPVIKALATSSAIESVVCATGQHRQMLDQVLEIFAIRPDHDLDVMQVGHTLNSLASRPMSSSSTAIRRRPWRRRWLPFTRA
jgi:UDP-N-acetylglucosamine 2-epimerase (non-hydrolysing)